MVYLVLFRNSPIMTVPKSWNVVIAVLIQIGLLLGRLGKPKLNNAGAHITR